MGRPRPLWLLLVLLAACDGGEKEPIARPHELRLDLVRGAGMRVPVRPVDAPAGQAVPSDEPVIVQVSALVGASVQALPGGTGPALAVQLPAMEIHWRALEPWCQPLHAVTPLVRGDTVHNYYVRPTVAGLCRVEVKGVTGSWVFDTDTAFASFDPGPTTSFDVEPVSPMWIEFPTSPNAFVRDRQDAYGNRAAGPLATLRLVTGSDVFTIDSLVNAVREGAGTADVTVGALTRRTTIWALHHLGLRKWRVSWACYGLARPGEAHTDSVHYMMDTAAVAYGSLTGRGVAFGLTGDLVAHEWRRGEAVRSSTTLETRVFGWQQIGRVEWSRGQVAPATATGYAGGSLCAPPGEGLAWERSGPARMERQ